MKKPKVKLTGTSGNIFSVLGICQKALRKNGNPEKADELAKRVMTAGSYDKALSLCMEYVDAR